MCVNSSAIDGLCSVARISSAPSGSALSRLSRMVLFRSQESSRASSIKSNYNTCWSSSMTDRVSTMDVRQRIGDMLNRVALRHDEFIIERKGKPLAALVPVERLEQMRRFARRHALDVMEQQKGGALTDGRAAFVLSGDSDLLALKE